MRIYKWFNGTLCFPQKLLIFFGLNFKLFKGKNCEIFPFVFPQLIAITQLASAEPTHIVTFAIFLLIVV